MAGMPRINDNVRRELRPRICNTKTVVATTEPRQITSQDNNKQGVIIQNQSAVTDVFVSFDQGTQNTTRLKIVPGGSISFDFAVAEPLYCFTTAGTANCVVLEVTGFDTYQLLNVQLLEIVADNTSRMVNLLSQLVRGSLK